MTISSLKKHLSLNRAVLLVGLLFILCSASSQSYYNRIYDYQNENPEGAFSGNLLFHSGYLYSIGVRAGVDGAIIVLSKWDQFGDLVDETTVSTQTFGFYAGPSSNFFIAENKFYYSSSGMNGDSFAIYCFSIDMEFEWVRSYNDLEGFAIAGLRKMLIMEDKIYLSGVHFADAGQWYFVAQFNLEGEFDQFIFEPQETEPIQHLVSSQVVTGDKLYVSGDASTFDGIPSRNGFISKVDTTNGNLEIQIMQGNPNHIDSPIFIEDHDENHLLGVQLITDSIYTGGLLPNENYWFNHLSTFLVDKETLEVSEMENHQHFALGNLFHLESHESGFGLVGNQDAFLGSDTDGWVSKFTSELEQEYHFSINYLPCSTGCQHILYDLAFDDFGNGYAIGRADLDTLNLDGRYSWMVAFDCHGRTEEPEFNSGIDSMLTQSGNYFLQPTSEQMDDYYWTFNNQEIYSENVLLEMEEGQNNITLHSTYCGREFEENMVIDVPININEVQNNPVLIYPNPVQDQLFLKGGSNSIEQLEIYSTDGKLLLSQALFNTGSALDVSALPSGNYVLTYQQGIEHFAIQFSKVE